MRRLGSLDGSLGFKVKGLRLRSGAWGWESAKYRVYIERMEKKMETTKTYYSISQNTIINHRE